VQAVVVKRWQDDNVKTDRPATGLCVVLRHANMTAPGAGQREVG
jgi:hypothetical protein